MPKTTRTCKVCGKEYEYCKTWLNTNKFRYQDVACSPECGAEYFRRIAISRNEVAEEPKPVQEKSAGLLIDDIYETFTNESGPEKPQPKMSKKHKNLFSSSKDDSE